MYFTTQYLMQVTLHNVSAAVTALSYHYLSGGWTTPHMSNVCIISNVEPTHIFLFTYIWQVSKRIGIQGTSGIST